MQFLKDLYHTLRKALKWKYFKVLNRKPVNKTHWAFIIIYAILSALINPFDQVDDKMYLYTFFGGGLFIHFCLNYYFLIYKSNCE